MKECSFAPKTLPDMNKSSMNQTQASAAPGSQKYLELYNLAKVKQNKGTKEDKTT